MSSPSPTNSSLPRFAIHNAFVYSLNPTPPLQLHRDLLNSPPDTPTHTASHILPKPVGLVFGQQGDKATAGAVDAGSGCWRRCLFTMRRAEARPIPGATSLLFRISWARKKMKKKRIWGLTSQPSGLALGQHLLPPLPFRIPHQ